MRLGHKNSTSSYVYFIGLLRHKTRLLVTHSLAVLPYVNRIVFMEKGVISRVGTYEELRLEDAMLMRCLSRSKDNESESESRKISETDSLRYSLSKYEYCCWWLLCCSHLCVSEYRTSYSLFPDLFAGQIRRR